MGPELEGILRGRHGEEFLRSVVLMEPTDEEVATYKKHGSVYFTIDLSGTNSSDFVIDTGRLEDLRHAWIHRRHPQNLTLSVSDGTQPIPKNRLGLQTYNQRVEGLELEIYPNQWPPKNPRAINYTDKLTPLL